MPAPAQGPTAVMLLGGSATSERPSTTRSTVILDLAMPEAGWRPGPPLAHARSHLNTVILPDGTLAAFGGGVGNRGGSNYAGPIFRSELLAPGRRWRAGANAAEERTYHAVALLLPDGRVLTAGDDRLSHQALERRTQELYWPPYLFRGARPSIASAPATIAYGETFRVASRDASRVRRAVLLSPSAVTHATDMGGRSIELALTPAAAAAALRLMAPADPSLAGPRL